MPELDKADWKLIQMCVEDESERTFPLKYVDGSLDADKIRRLLVVLLATIKKIDDNTILCDDQSDCSRGHM